MQTWQFTGHITFLGFGSVARTALQLAGQLLSPVHVTVLDKIAISHEDAQKAADHANMQLIESADAPDVGRMNRPTLCFVQHTLTEENMAPVLSQYIRAGHATFDFMFCVDSLDTLRTVQSLGSVYVNSSMEEWEHRPYPTQVMLYDVLLDHMAEVGAPMPTAAVDCGANPGLVTHFVIVALFEMASRYAKSEACSLETRDEVSRLLLCDDREMVIGRLSEILDIRRVHITEEDTITPCDKDAIPPTAFPNTWSVESLRDEWFAAGEVAVGHHDRESFEEEGEKIIRANGTKFSTVPYPTFALSEVPLDGKTHTFVGRVVRHPETLEIAEILRRRDSTGKLRTEAGLTQGPTVAFVYRPTELTRTAALRPDAAEMPACLISEREHGTLAGREAMGGLVMSGLDGVNPMFCGSLISSEQTRELGCKMNGTVMQVAISAVCHMKRAMQAPNKGVVMPHTFESRDLLSEAEPYLGDLVLTELDHLPLDWKTTCSALGDGYQPL
ncbi:Saccharopine dehydrogenase / Homospermidine synthase [Carpediemonas membranifera]|uniref:Saccharopine dehydrogenase / Homospermidine synthase n=1 Tax=Carpediemonas membranifera TaxID=201153 RepID=A0A8J6DYS1_9EUKA|nr:Saccharopine dehydrogenase / Homospermidine synthase [Carpediemonas membranifera]|eukprot:KAG9392664.1 Saccharopine dehydrogenase / Homospermidine synthase [Carpediemonas membranifera]